MIMTRSAEACGQADFGWLQPRTYPDVDVLNLILQGEAEYRDSEGNYVTAREGEALLLSARQHVSYSEINLSKVRALTRMQLWLAACPAQENPLVQKMVLSDKQRCLLLASPDGAQGSLQLRQQVWIHYLALTPGEVTILDLKGPRAYLQSIHGSVEVLTSSEHREKLGCGDGAFVQDERQIQLMAKTPLRALVIDIPV